MKAVRIQDSTPSRLRTQQPSQPALSTQYQILMIWNNNTGRSVIGFKLVLLAQLLLFVFNWLKAVRIQGSTPSRLRTQQPPQPALSTQYQILMIRNNNTGGSVIGFKVVLLAQLLLSVF